MRQRLFLGALLTGTLLASAAPGDERPYRLSGIAGVEGNLRALFEWPDGQRRWVQLGDTFEGSEVAEITDKWVRLRSSEGEQIVKPTGGDPIAVDTDETLDGTFEDILQNATSGGATPPTVSTTEVSRETFRAFQHLASGAAPDDLPAKLNELIGLPEGARIFGIDSIKMTSSEQVLEVLTEALRREHAPHIWANTPSGLHEVYLLRQPENAQQ